MDLLQLTGMLCRQAEDLHTAAAVYLYCGKRETDNKTLLDEIAGMKQLYYSAIKSILCFLLGNSGLPLRQSRSRSSLN